MKKTASGMNKAAIARPVEKLLFSRMANTERTMVQTAMPKPTRPERPWAKAVKLEGHEGYGNGEHSGQVGEPKSGEEAPVRSPSAEDSTHDPANCGEEGNAHAIAKAGTADY